MNRCKGVLIVTKTHGTCAGNLVPLLAFSALLLVFAAPAAAEKPAASDCAARVALVDSLTPAAVLFGSAPPPTGAALGDIGAQATCTAKCGDGTSVTCTAGSSCTAEDSDCSGSRGTCTDAAGTKNCPYACCSNLTRCSERHGTSCMLMTSIKCSSSAGYCGSCFCDGTSWVCEQEA